MAASSSDPRLTFYEAMELVRLPLERPTGDSLAVSAKFMSLRPAWLLGSDYEDADGNNPLAQVMGALPRAVYGGHVYTQAPFAASRVLEEEERNSKETASDGDFGFHVSDGTHIYIYI
jgi:hypothetical protein